MQKLITFLAASLLSISAQAGLVDFTKAPVETTGKVAGVGYELTAVGGPLNFSETFNGSKTKEPCLTLLACDQDGIGIGFGVLGDEVSHTEMLTITFDQAIEVTGLYFLDMFSKKAGTEEATITFSLNGSDSAPITLLASAVSNGGFAALTGLNVTVDKIIFSAADIFGDDGTNDFALAGISAVPVPAAAFLFAPALIGFMGLRRKAKKA
jgi:hypothetical protein